MVLLILFWTQSYAAESYYCSLVWSSVHKKFYMPVDKWMMLTRHQQKHFHSLPWHKFAQFVPGTQGIQWRSGYTGTSLFLLDCPDCLDHCYSKGLPTKALQATYKEIVSLVLSCEQTMNAAHAQSQSFMLFIMLFFSQRNPAFFVQRNTGDALCVFLL